MWTSEGMNALELCPLGETDGVLREGAFTSVWSCAMVDHRAVHPARAAVVGSVGFPALEGRSRPPDTPSQGRYKHVLMLTEKAFYTLSS